jgi:hypothetical protein
MRDPKILDAALDDSRYKAELLAMFDESPLPAMFGTHPQKRDASLECLVWLKQPRRQNVGCHNWQLFEVTVSAQHDPVPMLDGRDDFTGWAQNGT